MRPRALDLFCGAGGATRGLQDAGFHVTGVDLHPQPRYVGDAFHQADAMTFPLEGFDFIWASPPCQAYTAARSRSRSSRRHPDLVGPVRLQLSASRSPWVIENVPGAPLRFTVELCGATFGLGAVGADGVWRQLRRHRLFESSFFMLAPPCCCNAQEKIGVYGHGGGFNNRIAVDRAGYQANAAEARWALGVPWMTRASAAQAIPPAYAEWIGEAALQHLATLREAGLR